MKKRSPLILLTLVILIASCGKKGGDTGLLVPEDAAVVFHMNMASLSSKLTWEEISQTQWFKMAAQENNDSTTARLMANPASSGINTKADLVMYMKKQGRGSYMVVTGNLADAASFEKFIREMAKTGETTKRDGFNVMSKNDNVAIWNESRFAWIGNANMPDMNNMRRGGSRSYSMNRFSADSLTIFGVEALTIKGGDNLDGDSRFASLIKDGSDIHLWVNMSQYYNEVNMALPMVKTDIFKGNLMAASFTFDNGKITAKTKQYYSDEMNRILANSKAENIKADVINRIPSSNVVAVIAVNFSTASFKEILKSLGVDQFADMFLAKANITIDDIINATKGQMLVSVGDPMPKGGDTINLGNGQTHVIPSSKQNMGVLFAAAVNDKVAFEKLITFIWDLSKQFGKGRGGDEDNMPSTPGNIPGVNYKLDKDWFVASNRDDYVAKFLEGGNNKFDFTDKITGHPVGVYLDLQKMIKMSGHFGGHASGMDSLNSGLSMWQDIVATGGEFKDKAIQFEVEINLVDKNTNSLKQLNSFFDKMMAIRRDKVDVEVSDIQQEGVKDEPTPPPPAKK
jgi:hypothetical protein